MLYCCHMPVVLSNVAPSSFTLADIHFFTGLLDFKVYSNIWSSVFTGTRRGMWTQTFKHNLTAWQLTIVHVTWRLINTHQLAQTTLLHFPVKNCSIESAGGLKRDKTSLCMPVLPSPHVNTVTLQQPVLVLQFLFPPQFPTTLQLHQLTNSRFCTLFVPSRLQSDECNSIFLSFFITLRKGLQLVQDCTNSN